MDTSLFLYNIMYTGFIVHQLIWEDFHKHSHMRKHAHVHARAGLVGLLPFSPRGLWRGRLVISCLLWWTLIQKIKCGDVR